MDPRIERATTEGDRIMSPFTTPKDWPEFGSPIVRGGMDAPAPPAPSEQQAPPPLPAPRPARRSDEAHAPS